MMMKHLPKAVFLFTGICLAAAQHVSEHRLALSLQRKLQHITENAKLTRPDPAPTVMTEEEVNDYFAAGNIKLPQGVTKITFQGRSGQVTTLAVVDFDQIRAGQRSSNPLLAIFSGTHNVLIESDASGSEGRGKVHVRSVSIDGTAVPNFALEIFVDRFLKPKYPNVGIDSVFDLPNRIDTAVVGYHKLTVTQK
jgi:hypothetical protein